MQSEFLAECLSLLRGRLHTAVQTSGFAEGNVFDRVLSLDLVDGAKKLSEKKEETADDDFSKYVEEQLALRAQAKKEKNWAEADRIRDELTAQGIKILDTPQGAKWSRE